jgi:hypothetical protein
MRKLLLLFSVVLLFSTSAMAALDPTVKFSSVTGASIKVLAGGSFTFTNNLTDGRSFEIDLTENFPGTEGDDLLGLQGTIGGLYQIGAISPTGTGETATVTGSGTFSIFDATPGLNALTGTVTFVDITTSGTGSTLNVEGTVNLSGLTYSGSNAGLQRLASYPAGIVTASFTLIPAQTLTSIKGNGATSTYSGTLTAVPEPGHYAALLSSGLGVALWVARRRRLQ